MKASPHNQTEICINGTQIIFSLSQGILTSISNHKFTQRVKSFINEWCLTENTSKSFYVAEKQLVITTPDGKKHHCKYIVESFTDQDNKCVYVRVFEGTETIEHDYDDCHYKSDIGRAEIIELISDALASELNKEHWPVDNFSFEVIA